jgi:SAM-dependent methyltransferase
MDNTPPIQNKNIKRDDQQADTIFDRRTLDQDYRTLSPLLRKGIHILDVGCGTGALTREMADLVGPMGSATGIDNTKMFIESGRLSYGDTKNLYLEHVDLFTYEPVQKFDLIVSARTLQWVSNVPQALHKMKDMLKPSGMISILDYNHTTIEWVPDPPVSMQIFYESFLKWRSDAGMNNQIADDLAIILTEIGFKKVEILNADLHYTKGDIAFDFSLGIWSKVASSKQMVEEGYISDTDRLRAIADYDEWIKNKASAMTLKMNDVRGYR